MVINKPGKRKLPLTLNPLKAGIEILGAVKTIPIKAASIIAIKRNELR
jgi:hypothetical protein